MASSHPLVERFRSGDAPEPLKAAAARGALPLAPEDLVEILFYLRKDPSKEIQRDIVKTLDGMAIDGIARVISAPDVSAPIIDFLARGSIRREPVLELVLQSPVTADATLHLLAQHGSESILEFLSFNQVRLAKAPGIMQAMLANARLSPSIRRRLEEIAELHAQEVQTAMRRAAQEKAQAPAPEPAPVAATAPVEAQPAAPAVVEVGAAGSQAPPEAQVPAPASTEDPDTLLPEDLGDLADLASATIDQRILDEMAEDEATEEELRLAVRLLTMSIPDKVQLAMKGNRDARMVLIRDSSKQVQEAVVNSPKITDNEIERIAKMRSISEDVIRLLTNKREAMKIYSVVKALVHNPKCPQHTAMTLMQQLQSRDLQFITKDKNVSDSVRRHALITLDKRKPKGAPGKK
jgi:hypothetical protein